MQRADVVQNVRVPLHEHEEEHEEVQAPEHLQDPHAAKIALHVEEAEVSVAGKPHVACDHDADGIVDLRRAEVVVQEEHVLHPPFPLFGLLAMQQIGGLGVPHRERRSEEEGRGQEPEKIHVLLLARMREDWIVLADEADQQDGS
eukprot:scaffold2141_cov282-Pinguiococcus_pyrenoidosus.AAC.15